MLISAFTTYEECDWLGYEDGYFVDDLAGGEYLRKTVDDAKRDVDPPDMVESIADTWADDCGRFRDRCESALLY
jgi:beta-N-acetylhexosaminidase